MERYAYEDLPHTGSLRLLFVEPVGDYNGDIHCSLRIFPMTHQNEYITLSYSWAMEDGDAGISKRIIIDGKALGITRNLHEGLQRIYGTHRRQMPIWVDAICINQSNTEERNSQVAQMGQVYANAAEVICWLGNGTSQAENDNIATIMECCSNPKHSHFREHQLLLSDGSMTDACLAHAGMSAATALINNTDWDERPLRQFPDCIKDLFDTESLENAMTEVWALLRAFFRERHWTRRWIVQEVNLAGLVRIMWADHQVTEQRLRVVFDQTYYFFPPYTLARLGYECQTHWDSRPENFTIQHLFGLREELSDYAEISRLQWAIYRCRKFECLDPRDKVFALLSLDQKTTVRPDYGLSVERVYTETWIDLLERGASLTTLLWDAAIHKRNSMNDNERSTALPSWCLDPSDTFSLDERKPTIGGWATDKAGTLSCSALVVGRLSSDLTAVEFIGTDRPSPERQESEVRPLVHVINRDFKYFYEGNCSPRDLICIFEDIDGDVRVGEKIRAVVLHPLDDRERSFRVISALEFTAAAWQPGTHPVKEIHIL